MVGIPEGIDTPDIMVELDVLQWNVDRMAAGLRARPAVMMRQTSPSVQLSGSVSEAVRASLRQTRAAPEALSSCADKWKITRPRRRIRTHSHQDR
ncbi:hypothetical protein ACGF13_34850 [Kitasatospora sp. NPDC048286]|uniref:hypothetical protein n=1 Tax=Kitasatospora sp. NPDC048286 TaxID=3364047 RepID=UPI003711E223